MIQSTIAKEVLKEKNTGLNMFLRTNLMKKSMKLNTKTPIKDPTIIAITMIGSYRLLNFNKDRAVISNKIALSALSTSEEKIGYGLVSAVVFLCILNALNNGFKTSTSSLIRKRISYSTGNVLNATFNIINRCPNITVIVENTSILNKIATLRHIPVEKFVERKEELTVLIIAQMFVTLKSASLVIMKGPS